MSETLKKACWVDDQELSPLAAAYARARGVDRMSSFGDWAALSDRVDLATANVIRKEVSDGVIAPDYDPDALEILLKKQGGRYKVLVMDPDYEPSPLETRQVFGVTFEQHINNRVVRQDDFDRIVTKNQDLLASSRRDLILSWITLKYTQSNSVCFALGGQTIGVGAGQQSRIHCTRLAASKAERWWLRQHPAVLGLPFRTGISRPGRDNAIDQFLQASETQRSLDDWQETYLSKPVLLDDGEISSWLGALNGVSLGSDAFFPFRDSIDRAANIGVNYVLQPGGSNRDADVIHACDQYGMVMIFTGVRLFHH
jgi:phosphoribosylaminoimidazolecarboxamide formyltransferase/IMP cyclohydrolase